MLGPVSLIINAGGESRRMGQPKAYLPVPPHNYPLILHIIQRLQPLCFEQIIIVANDPAFPEILNPHLHQLMNTTTIAPITILADQYPAMGPVSLEQLAPASNLQILISFERPHKLISSVFGSEGGYRMRRCEADVSFRWKCCLMLLKPRGQVSSATTHQNTSLISRKCQNGSSTVFDGCMKLCGNKSRITARGCAQTSTVCGRARAKCLPSR